MNNYNDRYAVEISYNCGAVVDRGNQKYWDASFSESAKDDPWVVYFIHGEHLDLEENWFLSYEDTQLLLETAGKLNSYNEQAYLPF